MMRICVFVALGALLMVACPSEGNQDENDDDTQTSANDSSVGSDTSEDNDGRVEDTGTEEDVDVVVPQGKPTELPTPSLFSSSSPFRQPIGASPTIDPDSADLIESFLDASSIVLQYRQYSTTVFLADESTPRRDVVLECGPVWELGVGTLKNVPIPDYAEPAEDVDGATNPPVECGEDADQDNFMVIVDTAQGCTWDFWQMRGDAVGGWRASWAVGLETSGTGVFPGGLSARGSGFSFLAGVIWPEELRSGKIEHALAFSYPFTKSGGPVAPATDSDGVTDADFYAIPMGARLQLDPAIDLDALGLTAYERPIAEAMQTYGLILVDTGGASGIGLYMVDPKSTVGDPYGGLLPNEDFVSLDNIPLDAGSWRVLELGPQDSNWRSKMTLPSNSCVTYE